MHEYGIAQNILKGIIEEAKKHKIKRVKEVNLEIGPLLMVTPQELISPLQSVAKGTIAEDMKIKIKEAPLKIKCKNNHISEMEESEDFFPYFPKLNCPLCGEEAEIISGKECLIKKIVGEDA